MRLRNLLFSFLLGVFSASFLTIFGTAMSRQTKENVCDAQSIPVHLHCLFENCHKSCNSKKHINEHFLSTAMDRHILNNSKTTPQAARGCGIRDKIFGGGLFMTSPDHLEAGARKFSFAEIIFC